MNPQLSSGVGAIGRFAVLLVLLLGGALSSATAKEVAPPWLAALAAPPAGVPYGTANHAVLLDEAVLDIDKTGVVTRRIRYAVRVLSRDGQFAAAARVGYDSGSEKIQSLQAWLIPSSGPTKAYGRKNIIDVAAYEGDRELYSEARRHVISARDDAAVGSVFGYEAVISKKNLWTQEVWFFQQTVPVELSRLVINLPEGWTLRHRTFNRSPIEPSVQGRSHSWELRQLPASESEPSSPSTRTQQAWLAIDFAPPAGAKAVGKQQFSSWQELSTFFSTFYDAAASTDAAMKTRADALVADAKTPWERISRLCRLAQQVNYMSINLDLGNAGGMKPRPATRVFQTNYGDCKDKAQLLRALLHTQGIDSFPVVVYSGDPTYVREEWVSPFQFNHCILAIRVDDNVDVPAAITHSQLGRLVIFDPTNEHTPPGWLAREDTHGLGLILAGAKGDLVRLPSLLEKENRFERRIAVTLTRDGSVGGRIEEKFFGNSSAAVREEHRTRSTTEYRDLIEGWLSRSLPGVRVSTVTAADDFDRAQFNLEIAFAGLNYGKMMRDKLLVFKPVLVARRESVAFKKTKRTQPVMIPPTSFSEHTEIDLPAGFAVDEMFAPVELSAPFGAYRANAEVRDHRVVFTRSLNLRAATLPPEQYEIARAFFEKILQAEQTPIVLKRL
jgi:transglutaminase-like putative cysteine protease